MLKLDWQCGFRAASSPRQIPVKPHQIGWFSIAYCWRNCNFCNLYISEFVHLHYQSTHQVRVIWGKKLSVSSMVVYFVYICMNTKNAKQLNFQAFLLLIHHFLVLKEIYFAFNSWLECLFRDTPLGHVFCMQKNLHFWSLYYRLLSFWQKANKEIVKDWVNSNKPRGGEDPILWGSWVGQDAEHKKQRPRKNE